MNIPTGYRVRGQNLLPCFPLCGENGGRSLTSEYPFAKYFLFVIVMSISVCSDTPRPADKRISDERW